MIRYGLLLMTAIMVAGCRYLPKLDEVLPDKRSEYKKSQTLPDLEVPPDLSTESINDKMAVPEEGATFSTYQERIAARKKAREEEGAAENAIEALSGEKVLVVAADADTVWNKLHSFWAERGYRLDLDDAEYGVQETDWIEDQENLVRDRYKVFAEAGEKAGTTTLYVSHDGEELRPEGEALAWKPQTGDTQEHDKLVADLKAYLGGGVNEGSPTAGTAAGGDDQFAVVETGEATSVQAKIVDSGDGKLYLAYPAAFAEAWTITGEALPRAGLTVEGEDKARGIYRVRYGQGAAEKKGILSKLAFWKGGDAEYQLSLTGVGKKTEIVVLDEDGKWDDSEAAGQILSVLKDELNKTL
ncbi:MAG: outer membrane protein assembly factor BamC [Chromatiales bacterium]